jgi:Nanos RNA binding domain
MSRNQSNRRGPNASFSQKVEKKPFCKVCCDAGKSEKDYTSHFVKDRDGKVTCPTLLGQECRYCFQPGHTVKFCEVLKKREQEKEKYAKECARADKAKLLQDTLMRVTQALETKVAEEKAVPRCGGSFAALADDSDSDEGSPRAQKEGVLAQQKMMTPSLQQFGRCLATHPDASAYEKGQAYFEKVDMGLTMEYPGAARFLRANGTSFGAVMLNTKQEKPKTEEEEFPSLSGGNVTLRPHQKSWSITPAPGAASFADKVKAGDNSKTESLSSIPFYKAKVLHPKVKTAVVSPVAQRDAWSDDEDAPAPLPVQSKPFKRILNWADCDSDSDDDYFSAIVNNR